jgi:hypothetical protein
MVDGPGELRQGVDQSIGGIANAAATRPVTMCQQSVRQAARLWALDAQAVRSERPQLTSPVDISGGARPGPSGTERPRHMSDVAAPLVDHGRIRCQLVAIR